MIGTITASIATKPGFLAKMEIYTDRGYLILENDILIDWEIEGLANPFKQNYSNLHTGASNASVNDTTNHEYIISSIKENKDPLITG